MKFNIQLLTALFSTLISNIHAYYAEVPSDMYYPHHFYQPAYEVPYQTYGPDFRWKRQQPFDLKDRITHARRTCANDLGLNPEEIPEDLLNVENPSTALKCMMACILQRLELMTKDNFISTKGIEKLANELAYSNPLVVSIAIGLAEQFNANLANRQISDPCEAGYLINQYIARQLRGRKLDV